MKFGGAGGQNTVPVEAQKPDAAPSSDDLYEPVGTMPMVGDRYVLAAGSIERSVKHGEIRVAQELELGAAVTERNRMIREMRDVVAGKSDARTDLLDRVELLLP